MPWVATWDVVKCRYILGAKIIFDKSKQHIVLYESSKVVLSQYLDYNRTFQYALQPGWETFGIPLLS